MVVGAWCETTVDYCVGNYTGFWGEPSSTIDWCEVNYLVHGHVAEFSNSLTSFFLVFAGAFPILFHAWLWKYMEARFWLANVSIIVVGLGSVAFHGTLQFRYQMWDEVPMLWTVVVVLYSLLEHDKASTKYGKFLPIALAVYAAVGTLATSLLHGNASFFSFHSFYGTAKSACIICVYKFVRCLDEREQRLRTVMKRGLYSLVLAIILWVTDLKLCSVLQKLPSYNHWNFHAFGWHLLVSCALYSLIVGLWYHRLKCVLGKEVKLGNFIGLIPVVIPVGGFRYQLAGASKPLRKVQSAPVARRPSDFA